MTVADLCTAALGRLLADGQAPSADDISTALDRLNGLIDGWKLEGLTIATVTRTTWAIGSGTTSYTVGTGGTIPIDRPVSPQTLSFAYIDSSVTPLIEIPVQTYTVQQYEQLLYKTQSAPAPQGFYYNPTVPTGTLSPWPVPNVSTLTGVVYAPSPLGEVALTDTLVVPQGYRRFYRDNLAVELAPDFGVQPSAVLIQSAVDSKAAVKKSNVRMAQLVNEASLLGGGTGGYNILTDGWR